MDPVEDWSSRAKRKKKTLSVRTKDSSKDDNCLHSSKKPAHDKKRPQLPLEDISSDSDGELTRPRKQPSNKRRAAPVAEVFDEVKRVRLVSREDQDYLSSLKDYSKLKERHLDAYPKSKRPHKSELYEQDRASHREVYRSSRESDYFDSLRGFDKFRKSSSEEGHHRQGGHDHHHRRHFDFEGPNFVRQSSSELSSKHRFPDRREFDHRRSFDFVDDGSESSRRSADFVRHEPRVRREHWPEQGRAYRDLRHVEDQVHIKLRELRYEADRVKERFPSSTSSSSMPTSRERQHVPQRSDHRHHPRDHRSDKVRFVKPEATSKHHQRQPSSLEDRSPKKPQTHNPPEKSPTLVPRSPSAEAPRSSTKPKRKSPNAEKSSTKASSEFKKSAEPPKTDDADVVADAKPSSPNPAMVKKPSPTEEPAGTSTAPDATNDSNAISTEEPLSRFTIRSRCKVQLLDTKFLTHLSEMHPTSALHELCTKLDWPSPNLTSAFECGPKIGRMYIFKAVVNGNEYQPTVAVDNKKEAKANAAWYALQEMGFVNKDLANPL